MYDKDILLSILIKEEFRTIDDDGKVFPPSNTVYTEISKAMQDKHSTISAKHVYTIVNTNRGGMHDTICRSFFVNVKGQNASEDSSFNVCGNNGKLDKPHTTTTRFKLVLSSSSWNKIKPKAKMCVNRTYYILKANKWTGLFAEKIWQQTKLCCGFSFKRAKVYLSDSAKCYAKFEANCKECEGRLIGVLLKKPAAKTDAVFECKLSESRQDVKHKKKRHLRGYLRDKIAGQMVAERKGAASYRINEATRLMDYGDCVPPILFSSDVLRKAKQQEVEKQLQITSTNPIENLYTAKHTTLPSTIHLLSVEPFICIYWLQEQRAMYASAHKYDLDSYFVIDATGSIAKKLLAPDGSKSQHIFLYQVICVSDMGNFPAFQCVTAAQDAATITYFLFQIARYNPSPRIVVSDFGLAILIAVARAFCGTDLGLYLQCCHRVVVFNDVDMVPKCFIRLDVSHFIAMIARWPSLKGKLPRVRQFYLRCLGRAYQLESFNDVENLLKSVLVVALSENIGLSNDDEKLPSEDFLQIASHHIRGVETQADDDDLEADEVPGSEEEPSSSWKHWAAALYDSAEEISFKCKDTGLPNPYYNPGAAKRLKDLMGYLPLCTGIMRKYFKCNRAIASSSYVEAEFSKLKDHFRGQLPSRIDKFVLRHINYLEGTLKLQSDHCHKNEYKNRTIGIHGEGRLDIIIDQTLDASLCSTSKIDNVDTDDTIPTDCSSLNIESDKSAVHTVEGQDIDKKYDIITKTTNENVDGKNLESRIVHRSSDVSFCNTLKSDNVDTDDTIPTDCSSLNVESDKSAIYTWEGLEVNKEYNVISTTIDEDEDAKSLVTSIEMTGNYENDLAKEVLTEKSDDDVTESLNAYEDWRKKINPPSEGKSKIQVTKRSKPNYLDPFPEWDAARYEKAVSIPVMQNGSLYGPVIIGKKRIIIIKTCAFDSLLQVTANAVATCPTYKNMIQNSNNVFHQLAQEILIVGKLRAEHYKRRATILSSVYFLKRTLTTRHVESIDAKCNAAHLADHLNMDAPSYTITTSCAVCQTTEETRPFSSLNVNVNILLNEGCQQMQQAIDNARITKAAVCVKCGNDKEVKTAYGPQVLIDTSVFTHDDYLRFMKVQDAKCSLNAIAKNLRVEDLNYSLSGLVHFERSIEHYMAYAWTGAHWHVYDDLRKHRATVDESTYVYPHVFIYVRNVNAKAK